MALVCSVWDGDKWLMNSELQILRLQVCSGIGRCDGRINNFRIVYRAHFGGTSHRVPEYSSAIHANKPSQNVQSLKALSTANESKVARLCIYYARTSNAPAAVGILPVEPQHDPDHPCSGIADTARSRQSM